MINLIKNFFWRKNHIISSFKTIKIYNSKSSALKEIAKKLCSTPFPLFIKNDEVIKEKILKEFKNSNFEKVIVLWNAAVLSAKENHGDHFITYNNKRFHIDNFKILYSVI